MKRVTAHQKSKDPVISEVYDLWEASGLSIPEFTMNVVTTQTLYNWFYGVTMTPHLRGLRALLNAHGYDLRVSPARGHNIRRAA